MHSYHHGSLFSTADETDDVIEYEPESDMSVNVNPMLLLLIQPYRT